MLKLVRIEFRKLRRKKLLWLMLLSAFIMPFFAFLYFNYFGETGIEPVAFYKWSAFGLTMFIILPFVLGVLCTILMYNEQRFDMLKHLWIVPVSRLGYFFSKFFVVLIYSVCFMLITAIASVLFSVLPGYVVFEWGSIFFLLKKCLEIALFTAFAMLPMLAIAAVQKSYIMSVCVIFYDTSQYVYTPSFLRVCHYCEKWGHSGSYASTDCSYYYGISLYFPMELCCYAICNGDIEQKKVR